ncbi:T9SS type A sorting domain-containing protein [bacterium]|nr:T9SS type A sorting domain-containing protein [bacterium]
MRILIFIITLTSIAFAQPSMDWRVIDNGGGMQTFGTGDTIRVSIGQGIIGKSSAGSVNLSLGFLYGGFPPLEIVDKITKPKRFSINSIAPNPFNSSCDIEFEITENCNTTIELYDMRGKKIGYLAKDKKVELGRYRVRWNAKNLSSGIYFVRISAADQTITRRTVLLK